MTKLTYLSFSEWAANELKIGFQNKSQILKVSYKNNDKDHILKMANSFTNLEPNIEHIKKTKEWLDNYDKKTGFKFDSVFEKNRYMFNAV